MSSLMPGVSGRARWIVPFALLLFAISAVPVLADPATDEIPRPTEADESKLPSAADVAQAIDAATEREFEEEQFLETPQAEQERDQSELAYADISAEEAEALLRFEFAEQLALIDQDPARALTDVQLMRVLSPTTAEISDDGDAMLMDGTAPVRALDEEGDLRKVDLELLPSEDGFVPANPVTDIKLPRDVSEPMTIGNSGLAIKPVLSDDESIARRFGEKDLLYPLPDDDMDLLAAPLSTGLELFASLRSRESPEVLRFELALPPGAELRPDGQGGAEVAGESDRIASIPTPTAFDAQGAEVPVVMRVEDSDLVLEVEHRSMDVAYPILVDPAINEDWYSYYGGTSWYANGSIPALSDGTWAYTSSDWGRFVPGTWPIYSTFGGSNRGLFISAKSISETQWAYRYGQWNYTAPGATTYIAAAGVYPFWRHDHNCSSGQYSQPHDYAGLWSPAWSPQYGWIQFQANAGSAYGMAFSEPPKDWREKTAQIYALGLGTGIYNTAAIPCWRDLYAGGAYVWLSDNEMPTFSKPVVADTWTDTAPVSIPVSGSDPGLGMKSFALFTTDSSGKAATLIGNTIHPCSGLRANPCPSSWSSQINNYNAAGLPNGINNLVAIAYDALGSEHYSQGQPVYVKVDHAPPVVTYSGELLAANPVKYHLDVTGTDGNSASFATAQSGMKGFAFYLDVNWKEGIHRMSRIRLRAKM